MAIMTLIHSQSTGRIVRLVDAGLHTYEGSVCYGALPIHATHTDGAAEYMNKIKRAGLRGSYDIYHVDTQSSYRGIGINYLGYECCFICTESYKTDSCNRPANEMPVLITEVA